MKLCLSIAPTSMDEALKKMKQSRGSADLIELRVDGIQDLDLPRLLRKPRPSVIVTNRRVEEGGKFTGPGTKQIEILSQAAALGAEYVDIEWSWGKGTAKQLITRSQRASVIVSYHNFQETPRGLRTIYGNMRSTGADVLKIATMANSIEDNKRLFDLCEYSKDNGQPIIAVCMGAYGEISRILGGKYGSYLTFGSASGSESTAPGQRTTDDLKNVFRINTLNSRTKVFGLVGNPVAQSKGTVYHNHIFARKSLNAVYVNFLVDNLEKFVSTFRDMIAGMSITMPFKQAILPLLDRCTEEASALGVVNTVVHQKRKLCGYNTDLAAVASLLKRRTDLRKKHAVVLGTGGTARTMAFAALANGAHTTVVGRTSEKSQILAGQLGSSAITYEQLNDVRCDVLMNATPVGMTRNGVEQNDGLIPRGFLRKEMLVFDAVYDPPETRLLRDARASGCEVITGIELFKHQARLQSKLFLESIS